MSILVPVVASSNPDLNRVVLIKREIEENAKDDPALHLILIDFSDSVRKKKDRIEDFFMRNEGRQAFLCKLSPVDSDSMEPSYALRDSYQASSCTLAIYMSLATAIRNIQEGETSVCFTGDIDISSADYKLKGVDYVPAKARAYLDHIFALRQAGPNRFVYCCADEMDAAATGKAIGDFRRDNPGIDVDGIRLAAGLPFWEAFGIVFPPPPKPPKQGKLRVAVGAALIACLGLAWLAFAPRAIYSWGSDASIMVHYKGDSKPGGSDYPSACRFVEVPHGESAPVAEISRENGRMKLETPYGSAYLPERGVRELSFDLSLVQDDTGGIGSVSLDGESPRDVPYFQDRIEPARASTKRQPELLDGLYRRGPTGFFEKEDPGNRQRVVRDEDQARLFKREKEVFFILCSEVPTAAGRAALLRSRIAFQIDPSASSRRELRLKPGSYGIIISGLAVR